MTTTTSVQASPVPTQYRELIIECMKAYRHTGIIRNMIDLMADFAAQGVRITHPNPRVQTFYRAWFDKVKGQERTERFLNYLYRCGNVVAKRHTAKLPAQESVAKLEADTEYPKDLKISRRVIPIRYTFLNPATLEVIGGELAQFVGKQVFAVRISLKLARLVNNPTPDTQPLIDMLPKDMVAHIKAGHRVITLDSDKLAVAHYKKDDWEEWADPVHYSILDDIKLYNKMKLADLSALDGAISQVRLWKLGDLDKGLFPTDVAVNKLSEILLSNPGGGAFDLIWGPELTLEESRTTVHQFLGEGKYKPVMAAIYEGWVFLQH